MIKIEKIIVIHPTMGELEKWFKCKYDADGNLIEKEFWGYDEIGVENGGKMKGDWV